MEDFNALYCVGWIKKKREELQWLTVSLHVSDLGNELQFVEFHRLRVLAASAPHCVVDIQFWSHVTPW